MQMKKNSAKSLTVFSTSIRTFLSPRFICFQHIVCIYNSTRSFSMQKLAKMFTNAIEYFHCHSRIMTQTRKISACKYIFTFKDNVPDAASWPNNWLFKSFERFGLAACFVNICFVIQIFGSTLSDCTLRYFTLLCTVHFAAEEIYLNSRTFLWPHELEQVLELSGARLSVVRENLEVALK